MMFVCTPIENKEELFAEAHIRYAKELKRHAFSKVHNHELSEDLVQETFLKAWTYCAQEKHVKNMRAFLYHILNCLIIDEYRRTKSISLDAMTDEGFDIAEEVTEQAHTTLDTKKALEHINSLPSKYQEVMHLKFHKDLSLHEISLLTGRSKNAVAVQIHRGLEKLTSLFGKN